MKHDAELIRQSIAKQYHILPSEQEELHYSDWISLLGGIMEDTPLGQTVLIRKENDKKRLEHFTEHEHRIRNEWRSFRASEKKSDKEKAMADISMFEEMFRKMLT